MIYIKSDHKLVTTALHEKPFKALISLHLKLQKWSFISLASAKNAENDIFTSSNPNISTVSVPSLAYHLPPSKLAGLTWKRWVIKFDSKFNRRGTHKWSNFFEVWQVWIQRSNSSWNMTHKRLCVVWHTVCLLVKLAEFLSGKTC